MTLPFHAAFFNRAFYPEQSATGRLLTELAEDLARKRGWKVTVVAGIPNQSGNGVWVRPPGWGLTFRQAHGAVRVLRARGTAFPKRIFWGRAANYLTYFGSACWAGLHLERPDVVVALTDPPIIGLAALLAARRFKVPLVMSYRDLFPEVGRLVRNSRSGATDLLFNRANRILLNSADRIVALGEDMREKLIREKGAPPDRLVLIPDWADCSAIVPGPKKNPFSLRHGLADRFVVMHAGNIGASQHLETLLEASEHLSDLPDLEVVFVGEGVQKNALKKAVAARRLSNVRFLPFQPKETLREAFATADCFVVSLKEGLAGYITPCKVYGILAAGRPFVACMDENGEAARIARTHQCGLWAPPGDVRRLADQIRALYRDKPLRERLGRNARNIAPRYDRTVGVDAYDRLLRSLVRPTGRNQTP